MCWCDCATHIQRSPSLQRVCIFPRHVLFLRFQNEVGKTGSCDRAGSPQSTATSTRVEKSFFASETSVGVACCCASRPDSCSRTSKQSQQGSVQGGASWEQESVNGGSDTKEAMQRDAQGKQESQDPGKGHPGMVI